MTMARQHWLHSWGLTTNRGRHDYDCPDHVVSEMMDASYFGAIPQCFTQGDFIYVTDAAQDMVTLMVDEIDAVNRRVWTSVLERTVSKPNTRAHPEKEDLGLTVRWKGPRGGRFCIVDKDGNILHKDYRTKEEAWKELELKTHKDKVAA